MTEHKDAELAAFLSAGEEDGTGSRPPVLAVSLRNRIERDLVRSKPRVLAVYWASALLGYGITLILCAQNGVGFAPLAHHVASGLHGIPWPWCPILCGAIFSAIPLATTRLFLSSHQHRFVLARFGWMVALVPVISAALLWGPRPHALAWVGYWCIGAFGVPLLAEGMPYLALRKRTLSRAAPSG